MPGKITFIIIFIFSVCIGGYFLTKSIHDKKFIEKEIIYSSNTASEVYMVWGINYLLMPSKEYWPINSFAKDGLVYTKMQNGNNKFKIKINLPSNTILNYWMVKKKDRSGNETEVWDSGGYGSTYFNVGFYYSGFLKPGYFIFLTGFKPLLMVKCT